MWRSSSASSGELSAATGGTVGLRFALAGAAAGFLAGLVEAALLGFIPRASGLTHPDVHYVIAFVAPLVDLFTGAILGLILGLASSLFGHRRPLVSAAFAAIGLGIIAGYIVGMLGWFRVLRPGLAAPVATFVLAGLTCFIGLALSERRGRGFLNADARLPIGSWCVACGVTVAVLSAGIAFYAADEPPHYPPAPEVAEPPPDNPNVVLMILDTVRADHFSCYGYSRPTTPNFDRLATRGVRFANAIAPTSWTLPSLASIFTGLLPHQHGADWGSAMAAGPWTLAKILRSKGYETAGFNANPFYGLGGWRLSEGFDVYFDESYAIRHNLAVTFVGQSALQYLYDRAVRYNQFDHLTASDLNEEILRWYRHRDPTQPFFLFINYMDAHRPYLPPPPYDRRFGRMSRAVLAKVTASLNDGRPPSPYTPKQRSELIDGYDNSLAYLDAQSGRLIRFLSRQPGGSRTYFIVTADHGEGFGEHGTYDHGWNLYNEVLRVPLIVAGPGVPVGKVVTRQVGIRGLFSTVVDLALKLKGPVRLLSLRRLWESGATRKENKPPETVSELDVFLPHRPLRGLLSLMTPKWHLIEDGDGKVELYNEISDPAERDNLANNAGAGKALGELEQSLETRIADSLLPWRDLTYLNPLNRPDAPFLKRIRASQLHLAPQGIPAGAAQAIFSHSPPSQLLRPNASEQDLLRTLPYH